MGDCVRGLERGHDPLEPGEETKRRQGRAVRDALVGHAAAIPQERVFGPHPRIVETRGNAVRFEDLTIVVLKQDGARAMQNPRAPRGQCGRVLTGVDAVARGLDAHEGDGVIDQRVEHPHGIRAAAHTGHHHIGKAAEEFEALRPGLAADHRLKVAHHARKRIGTHHRANEIVRVAHVGHPLPHGRVDGVLERAAARGHGNHLRAEKLHALHVRALTGHIDLAHEHPAGQTEQGAGGGGGDAVLAGPRLRDDPLFAQTLREQGLADGVVDLVRAGVIEILALQEDPRSAGVGGESLGEIQRRRSTHIVREQMVEARAERWIEASRVVARRQLVEGERQGLRYEPSSVVAEIAWSFKRVHRLSSPRPRSGPSFLCP